MKNGNSDEYSRLGKFDKWDKEGCVQVARPGVEAAFAPLLGDQTNTNDELALQTNTTALRDGPGGGGRGTLSPLKRDTRPVSLSHF